MRNPTMSKKTTFVVVALVAVISVVLVLLQLKPQAPAPQPIKLNPNAIVTGPLANGCAVNDVVCISEAINVYKPLMIPQQELDGLLAEVLKNIGVEEGLKVIKNIYLGTKFFQGQCNDGMEHLGSFAWKTFGSVALDNNPAFCRSMFQVGVLIAASEKLSIEELVDRAGHLCDNDPELNGCIDGTGKVMWFTGKDSGYATKACTIGSKSARTDEDQMTAGCMMGYVNWSKTQNTWDNVETPEKALEMCEPSYGPARPICQGDALRTWVRAALYDKQGRFIQDNSHALERLERLGVYCRSTPAIAKLCGPYIGFSIVDVLDGVRQAKSVEIAAAVDRLCPADDTERKCLSSFVTWHLNQLIFGDRSLYDPQRTVLVCRELKVQDIDFCLKHLEYEIGRAERRMAYEAAE